MEISEVISLVEQAKEGDRGAFEALMRAYSGFVYSLALRMLGGRADAEDVFQETFFRAWSHLNSFRSGGVRLQREWDIWGTQLRDSWNRC